MNQTIIIMIQTTHKRIVLNSDFFFLVVAHEKRNIVIQYTNLITLLYLLMI